MGSIVGGASIFETLTVKLPVPESIPSLTVMSISTGPPDTLVEVTSIVGFGLLPWISMLPLGIIDSLLETADRVRVVGSESMSFTTTDSGPVDEFSSIA